MNEENASSNGSGSATGVVEQVQQAASQAVGQVQGKAGEVVGQAQEKAGQVVGQVQSEAVTRLSKQKEQAAEGLGAVAQALRHTSEELRSEDKGAVAQFAAQYNEVAVNQIEKVSTFLRDREVSDIVHEVEGFARREPALFIGGAFVLGVLAARFLKSSAPATPGSGSPNYGGSRAIEPYVPQATAITGTSPIGSGSYDAATFDSDTLPDAGDIGPAADEDSALTY